LTDDYFEIAVIPKTWNVTNFSHLRPGDAVNLEADIIAKYVERILTVTPGATRGSASNLTMEKLAELGYK
jgi:riboflavin synthase